MIRGTGIDAASIAHTGRLLHRFGERFTRRVFTEAERNYCAGRRHPAQSYAVRFAAKEAVMKALGSGWGSGVRFREIGVQSDERGRPEIVLEGGALARAKVLGVTRIHLSLSHHDDLALAAAITEGRDEKEG